LILSVGHNIQVILIKNTLLAGGFGLMLVAFGWVVVVAGWWSLQGSCQVIGVFILYIHVQG